MKNIGLSQTGALARTRPRPWLGAFIFTGYTIPPEAPRQSRQSRQSDYLAIFVIFEDLGVFFGFVFRVVAVLTFQMGSDRPNFESYCISDPKLAVGTRPEPFHATFRLPEKSATAKNMNFALDGYNRFMKPSWVRAHGLISRIYHIL